MRHSGGAPSLDMADSRKVFTVLEGVADFAGGEDFFAQFRELLAAHLGWTDSLVVDIPARLGPFPGRDVATQHFHSDRPSAFLDEYVDRWYMKNPFKTARAGVLLERRGHVSLCDLQAHSTASEWAFVDRYLHRHRVADVLNGYLGGRSGGALLCVYFEEESALGERDRALMEHLNRYLGAWVDTHFSRSGARAQIRLLSEREEQVAALVAVGLSNVQIAARLHITVDTVKKHLTRAMTKTESANRTQLALKVLGRAETAGA